MGTKKRKGEPGGGRGRGSGERAAIRYLWQHAAEWQRW